MFKLRYNFRAGDRVRHHSGKTGTVVNVDTWAIWVKPDTGVRTEPWSKDCTFHEFPPVFREYVDKIRKFLRI